jgi:hypothetical protein
LTSGFVEKSQLFQELPTVEVRLDKKTRRVMKRSVNKHAQKQETKKTYLLQFSTVGKFYSDISQNVRLFHQEIKLNFCSVMFSGLFSSSSAVLPLLRSGDQILSPARCCEAPQSILALLASARLIATRR